MTSRLPVVLLATAILVGAAACGDPTRPDAELLVTEDTLTLYALNGSIPAAPVAFSILDGRTRALNSSFGFDVAVDIDAQGNVLLYPARLVASPLVGTAFVGIQKVGESYAALTRAPRSGDGYKRDSATVLRPGEVAAIEVTSEICQFSVVGVNIYGKFVVDSVRPATREIFGRLTNNPNCGFRSLVPGLPED